MEKITLITYQETPCTTCTGRCLASTQGCAIYRRWDDTLDVRINETTYHMSASEFDVVARLFKLVLGMRVPSESPMGKKPVGHY